MSKHLGQLAPCDLCNLPNYTADVRLLVDGQPSRPYSIQAFPASKMLDPERTEIIRRMSQQRNPRPVGPAGVW